MTCIIAHRDGWMVADRRITFTGGLIGPYRIRKILRGPGILVGCAGDSILRTAVAEAVDGCTGAGQALESVSRAIRALPEQRGHALLVTKEHGLVEIDSLGACNELESDHWSIGSGFQAALGYLAAIRSGRNINGADALHAVEFAGSLNADVGDGSDIEFLQEASP